MDSEHLRKGEIEEAYERTVLITARVITFLYIKGERVFIELKDNLSSIKEECYWWKLEQRIDLPAQIYFDKIHSRLTPENILEIIIPKALIPEKINVEIEN